MDLPNTGVVVITGGSSGLGKATVELLAKNGQATVVLSRTPGDFREYSEISPPRFYQCDVRDHAAVERVAEEIFSSEKVFGLVNAAGVVHRSPFLVQDRLDWEEMVSTNMIGVFNVTHAFCRRIIEQNLPASIVNVASVVSLVGLPSRAVYAATKGAVAQFTRCLALELAPFGVRVNAVCPGAFETPMTAEVTKTQEGREWYYSRIPLRRLGEPNECAALIAFLLGGDSSYITGALIPVDGGWSA